MILFSCCIFLEKSWVHNTTQQLLVLGTQHQLMKLWMLVVGYTTTNCTKVGCWVHNNQQISDVVLCCVGSCWYNPCLLQFGSNVDFNQFLVSFDFLLASEIIIFDYFLIIFDYYYAWGKCLLIEMVVSE